MSEPIILFGAGVIGRYTLHRLRDQGVEPAAFADNDSAKWGTWLDKCQILSPDKLIQSFPDATWVASVAHNPFGREVRAQIERMGVRHRNLYECLSAFPSTHEQSAWLSLGDTHSLDFYGDQLRFRKDLDCDTQIPAADIKDIYFPAFITRRPDEHFLDCGAADGDTVRAFMERWPKFARITALEPDSANFSKLSLFAGKIASPSLRLSKLAVSDHDHWGSFTANGDTSSHLDAQGATLAQCVRLDGFGFDPPPTYIKMDIEGAELEALWGAREIIRRHSPVLAVCAYHLADHLWQVPLLIHALNPGYALFFRRYAEGAMELIWYAVPPERCQ